ncbi:MAG TPA: Sca4 family spreading effector [Rickettsia endosymbiont of Pyrocoelia pectoralis]|nr:Sca4 family spreading effector [Rickettsia endosymbiont of Pyrocoelia pectoralis]
MSKNSDENKIEEEKQKLEQEEKEFLNQTTPPSPSQAGDNFFIKDSNTPSSTSSLNTLSGNIDDNGITDPITEAIRKQILEEQRRLIREHLLAEHNAEPQKNPDLGTYLEDDEKFKEFLKTLNADQSKRDLYDNALTNADLKKQLEAMEINGYRNIHNTFSAERYPGGFKQMSWDGPTQDSTRSQIVKNGVGAEICTLNETTHTTNPVTVRHNGKPVTINSYRTIDFPVRLDEKASGTMHLSLVAHDKDGNAPSVEKAVYFTAHYEATPPPNGIPKLKEVSSPQPIKFLGDGKDAVGYIEHGGEIYTLPVTRGKYQEMMKEVAINKGQAIDVSQTIAPDFDKEQEQTVTPQQVNPTVEKPIETKNTEIPKPQQVPPITPASQPVQPEISQPPQPQRAESGVIPEQGGYTGIPKQVVNAAADLSKAMQDFLKNLENIADPKQQNDLIKDNTNKALESQNALENIGNLTKEILNSPTLNAETKEVGVSAVLDTVKDSDIADKNKAEIYTNVTKAALNTKALDDNQKQRVVEKVVEVGLVLKEQESTKQAIEDITKNVLDSELVVVDKTEIVKNTTAKVAESDLDSPNKALIAKSIGKAITEHDMPILLEKQAIMESAEQGVIENKADLETKKLMTEGLVNGIHDGNVELPVKSKMTDAVSKAINGSSITDEEKKSLKDVADKTRIDRESQSINDFDTKKAEQAKEETIAAVQGVLVNPAFNAIAKAAELKNITTNVLDGPAKAEIKGEIVEGITKTVAESSLDAKDRAKIVESIGETIATHKTMPSAERATVTAFAEQGIAGSATGLEEKKQMTAELVNGVYDGKESPAVTSELGQAVVQGVNQSAATPEEKNIFAATAQEAMLERETQSLTQDLQGQDLNKDLSQNLEQTKLDLYGAAKNVTDALKDVVDPAIKALETKEEQVVRETSGILNNVSQFVINKAESIRKAFSSSNDFKTAEEKRAESEQRIKELVEGYKEIDKQYEPEYKSQEAQGTYNSKQEYEAKEKFIEQSGLGDNEKIKLLSAVIQYERDNNASKPGVNNNVMNLTENRSVLEGKVAEQDKAKTSYSEQVKPRTDLGLGGSGSKNGGRTP